MKRMILIVWVLLWMSTATQASAPKMAPDVKAKILKEEIGRLDEAIEEVKPKKVSSENDKQIVAKEQGSDFVDHRLEALMTLSAQYFPLHAALKQIANVLGVHLEVEAGVENNPIDCDAHDLPVGNVLSDLLRGQNYGFRLTKDTLIVIARETRMFHLALPPVMQSFNDTTSNESFVQSNSANTGAESAANQQVKLGTKILVENSSVALSFWDDIRDNVKALISKDGLFSINKPAGTLVVTDNPVVLNRVARFIEELNARVTQQVSVDVKVVEVNLTDQKRFGVDWSALAADLKTLNSLGMASDFASGNFTSGQFLHLTADGSKDGSGVSENGIRLAINALAKQGRVDVVSQPKVTILNNQAAVIQVGSTQSYIDKTSRETTQNGTITSISTSQVQEGVTMRLMANMIGDDIYLSVAPVVTTIDGIRSINSGNTTIEAPQTTTKSINTLVKVKSADTVIIGGLMTSAKKHDEQGVPILSKVPVLGKLFQYKADSNAKTELIVFITPRKIK